MIPEGNLKVMGTQYKTPPNSLTKGEWSQLGRNCTCLSIPDPIVLGEYHRYASYRGRDFLGAKASEGTSPLGWNLEYKPVLLGKHPEKTTPGRFKSFPKLGRAHNSLPPPNRMVEDTA